MKNLIKETVIYKKLTSRIYDDGKSLYNHEVTEEEVDAIEIPQNATNGDMIKAIFPNAKVNVTKYSYVAEVKLPYHTKHDTGLLFDKDFWNAPYKGECNLSEKLTSSEREG